MVLTCISLKTNETELLIMCVLAIFISPLAKYLVFLKLLKISMSVVN